MTNPQLEGFKRMLLHKEALKAMIAASEQFDEESIRCLNCGRVVYCGPKCCDNPKYRSEHA